MRNVDGFGIAADHLQACLFDDLLHLHGEIWLEVAEVDHFGHLFVNVSNKTAQSTQRRYLVNSA